MDQASKPSDEEASRRRQTVIDQIRKLRSTAERETTLPGERENAESLAATLIRRYSITEDEIRDAAVKPDDYSIFLVDIQPPSPCPWVYHLAQLICHLYGVVMIRHLISGVPAWLEAQTGFTAEQLRGLEFVHKIVFIGKESDVAPATTHYSQLFKEVLGHVEKRLWEETKSNPPRSGVVRYTTSMSSSIFNERSVYRPLPAEVPEASALEWLRFEQSWAEGCIYAMAGRLENRDDEWSSSGPGLLVLDTAEQRAARARAAADWMRGQIDNAKSSKGGELAIANQIAPIEEGEAEAPQQSPAEPEPRPDDFWGNPLNDPTLAEMYSRGFWFGKLVNVEKRNESEGDPG